MKKTTPFEEDKSESQGRTSLFHDVTGISVVNAQFVSERKFSWNLFDEYDKLQVLTYSVSAKAIVRILEHYSFQSFECVFGSEAILNDFRSVLAFQKVVVQDTRAAIIGLNNDQHVRILKQIHDGKASFWVLRKHVAHAKLYLLSNADGRKRVITGSANLSERAFSEQQPETLIIFDNDENAWNHYYTLFCKIRDQASNQVEWPKDKIVNAEIEISDTPVMDKKGGAIVIEAPQPQDGDLSMPVQVERIEKIAEVLKPKISAAIPSMRNGKQIIDEVVKRTIRRISFVKSSENSETRFLTIDRSNREMILPSKRYSLEVNEEDVIRDTALLLKFWSNYEGSFEGNVKQLQDNYWVLMVWLYFSPFICDMRSLALLRDVDVIKYPIFAIIFGKSNCGKTSLVDTLMTSMLGASHSIDKRMFTTKNLRGLQQSYRRHPVVFDDLGRNAFGRHGTDMIKDETRPPVDEYPGFLLSMNADPHSFPDEVVKRCLMIYTRTALPTHNERLRQSLHESVQEIRHGLTTNLYRKFVLKLLDRLDNEMLPDDWMRLSSDVLSNIFAQTTSEPLPHWCKAVSWLEYAEHRYDRVKARLTNLLREVARRKSEADTLDGWLVEGDRIIVWEQQDAFGRKRFDWADVPSTLVDEDASGGGRTVLNLKNVEEFLGTNLNRRTGILSWIRR